MTIKRERPSGGDGHLDSRCLGSGKSNKNYSQSCRACGIPTQGDHLCPICRAWLDWLVECEGIVPEGVAA
jgi:hypothetical protein